MVIRRVMYHRNASALLLLMLVLPARPAWPQDATAQAEGSFKASAAFAFPPAAEPKRNSATGRFLRDIGTDQKAIWTSPAHMNRRQFFTVALPLAVVTTGLIATDEKAARLLANTPAQTRWCRKVSDIGALYTLSGFAVGAMTLGKAKDKPLMFQMGRKSAEALTNAVIVGYVMKLGAGRERPDQNDGEGRFWKGGKSFPSGHVMDSWAVAFAMARSPECPKWLAVTSYGVATVVSVARWGAHKHFPSDIVVGGVLGGLIGNYVARRPR